MAIANNPTPNQVVKAIKDIESGYLPKSGGTMTGPITLPSQTSLWSGKNLISTEGCMFGFNQYGQVGFRAYPSNDSMDSGFVFRIKDTTYLRFGNQNLRPETNNAYSIGTASKQFNYIYGRYIYQNGKQVANQEDLDKESGIARLI